MPCIQCGSVQLALSALLIPLRNSLAVILSTFAPWRCSRSGARKEPYALGGWRKGCACAGFSARHRTPDVMVSGRSRWYHYRYVQGVGMQVFVSWSGKRGRALAEAVTSWLKNVNHF